MGSIRVELASAPPALHCALMLPRQDLWPEGAPGPLGDNQVALWLVPLSAVPPLDCLSEDERLRASAAIDRQVGERYRAARRALRLILSAAVGQRPEDLLFGYNQARQPKLTWPPEGQLDFSLSYREDMALIAVSRAGPVGVDLETIDETIPAFDIAASEFATPESKLLATLPQEEIARTFTQTWVRKEALAKMRGAGLWAGLERDVVIEGEGAAWRDLAGLPEGFAGALAIEAAPAMIRQASCIFTPPPAA